MSNTYWAQFFVEEQTGLEVGFPTHAHQKHVPALQINQDGRPAPLAAACLLVLACLADPTSCKNQKPKQENKTKTSRGKRRVTWNCASLLALLCLFR